MTGSWTDTDLTLVQAFSWNEIVCKNYLSRRVKI